MKYRLILLLISLLLLTVLLIYSDFFQVISLLLQINLTWVVLGFLLWFVGLLVRTARWRYLLSKAKIEIPFWRAARVYISGLFISNITPAKTGDPLRSVLLKAVDGKSVSSSLPSVFMERMFDVIVTIVISIIGISFLALTHLSGWLIIACIIYVFAFGIITYIVISEKRTKKFFRKLFSLFYFFKSVRRLESKVERFSIELHKAFVKYKDKKVLSVTFIYSLAVWIIEGLILFVSFKCLGIYISPLITTATTAITVLIAVLTFLPGGLGSSEAVTIIIYTTLFSLTASQVMAVTILARAFGYWIYVLLGAILVGTSKYKNL